MCCRKVTSTHFLMKRYSRSTFDLIIYLTFDPSLARGEGEDSEILREVSCHKVFSPKVTRLFN